MNIQGTSQLHGAHGVKGPHSNSRSNSSQSSRPSAAPSDEVQISAAGEAAANAAESGDIRSDLVAQVRNEIAAGTYETPEKLDTALDRLLDEVL